MAKISYITWNVIKLIKWKSKRKRFYHYCLKLIRYKLRVGMKTQFIKTCMNSCKTIDDFRDADRFKIIGLANTLYKCYEYRLWILFYF